MEWKNEAELFDLLRKQLYTAIVGDVLDTFGRRRQFFPSQCRPLRADMVVAGRAMTVLEVDIAQEPDQPFGLMFEALDSLRPHEVYVAAGGSLTYALWGELMSTAARARGATGAVLASMSRDTRGILALDFPVFSYGCYAQDQRGRGQVMAHHVPIEIEGVQVRPVTSCLATSTASWWCRETWSRMSSPPRWKSRARRKPPSKILPPGAPPLKFSSPTESFDAVRSEPVPRGSCTGI